MLKGLVGLMTSGSLGVVCRGGLMVGILMMEFYLFSFISLVLFLGKWFIGYRSE